MPYTPIYFLVSNGVEERNVDGVENQSTQMRRLFQQANPGIKEDASLAVSYKNAPSFSAYCLVEVILWGS